MKKTKYKLKVEMIVEVEIDQDHHIVQEYESNKELLSDIVSYRFSPVLPVIEHGAVTFDFQDTTFEVLGKGYA